MASLIQSLPVERRATAHPGPFRWLAAGAALAVLAQPVDVSPGVAPSPYRVSAELLTNKPGELSVLTYNVAGLPWPVGTTTEQFGKMAERLRQLRALGAQPQIVVLQEAFNDEARALGRAAGYRHAAFGPSADDPRPAPAIPLDPAFVAERTWLRGEKGGPSMSSGLAIFSDYPIVATVSRPYPRYACAGLDCRANKGMLVASIRLPGESEPIDIATTHMNARFKSLARKRRTMVAYQAQLAALDAVVGAAPDRASIFAGDFNVSSIQRYQALTEHSRRWQLTPVTAVGVIRSRLACGGLNGPCGTDLPIPSNTALARSTDWQFIRPGKSFVLRPLRRVWLFGREADGSMLSDHYGYSITYRIERRAG